MVSFTREKTRAVYFAQGNSEWENVVAGKRIRGARYSIAILLRMSVGHEPMSVEPSRERESIVVEDVTFVPVSSEPTTATVCRLYIYRARAPMYATHFSAGYGTLFRARLRKQRRNTRPPALRLSP